MNRIIKNLFAMQKVTVATLCIVYTLNKRLKTKVLKQSAVLLLLVASLLSCEKEVHFTEIPEEKQSFMTVSGLWKSLDIITR